MRFYHFLHVSLDHPHQQVRTVPPAEEKNQKKVPTSKQDVTQKENGILIRRISILIWSKNAYINMIKGV